ncbi:MAG: Ppx/GppA phosphatase family protein [Breznakibacter sp.]
MRTAIIDIGTNTINLLVVDQNSQTYHILHESKYPAKLGKGGINQGILLPEAMERGVEALETHLRVIKDFNVESIFTIATSAIRNSANGAEFCGIIKEKFGLDVRVINGEQEAQLIFDGVKQVVPIGNERILILDIGGGSNEFIIANKEGVLWKQSFELGMARLLDKFHPSDPITTTEIKAIEGYVRSELAPLYEAIRQYPVNMLIGSSGSFDTIAAMIAAMHHPHLDITQTSNYFIPVASFEELHRKLLASTAEQRLAMKKMDPHRVDMIVLASIFINFVIREMRISQLQQCNFALKEGVIFQIVNHQLS